MVVRQALTSNGRMTMAERDLHKSILIVDDEEDLRWSLSKTLEKNDKQFEVICVQDGDAAWEILTQRRIDVVISDLRMPGRDGLQLLHDIHANYPGTKVIIMTAHGAHEVRDQILAYGTRFYVEKPFEIRHLRTLIYEALDLAPPAAAQVEEPQSPVKVRQWWD